MRIVALGPIMAASLLATSVQAETELAILPRPAQMVQGPGDALKLAPVMRVRLDRGDVRGAWTVRYIDGLLAQSGTHLVATTQGTGAIRMARTKGLAQGAYRLDVTPRGITILASDAEGQFHGAVTLWQILTARQSRTLPALHIEDAPAYAWRGLMLDSARHMQSPAFIERYLDWMALHKLNIFHWHLSDDQGWRIPIPAYPRLTSVGGWRDAVGPDAQISPTTGKPAVTRYGGFYTAAQIRHIVAYAAQRHITIVPEIDMPGHMTAAIAAYPALGVPGFAATRTSSDWGILPNLLNADDATFTMVDRILDGVMALFPGPYIHIGGDEATKEQWKASPAIQQRIRDLGLANEEELAHYFAMRVGAHLAKRGRQLVGWDDIVSADGKAAGKATVMSWHPGPKATAAIRQGDDVVIADAPIYYLDNQAHDGPASMPSWTETQTIEAIYSHDPVPSGLTAGERKHIVGVEGPLWTERARRDEWIMRLVWPRAAAIAETGWTPAPRRDLSDFLRRMAVQRQRYAALGLPMETPAPADPERLSSRDLDFCIPKRVGVTMEGPVPVNGQPVLFKVDSFDLCWARRRVDLTGISHMRISIGQAPFTFYQATLHLPAPHTPTGEMEVHLDSRDGPLLASIPLQGVSPTRAPQTFNATLPATKGVHDLYFVATGPDIDPRQARRPPMTFLDWVALDGARPADGVSRAGQGQSEG